MDLALTFAVLIYFEVLVGPRWIWTGSQTWACPLHTRTASLLSNSLCGTRANWLFLPLISRMMVVARDSTRSTPSSTFHKNTLNAEGQLRRDLILARHWARTHRLLNLSLQQIEAAAPCAHGMTPRDDILDLVYIEVCRACHIAHTAVS